MIDAHVHVERGPYTADWIQRFVDQALAVGLDELCLLEHSHRFVEFSELYEPVRNFDRYQEDWYARRAGKRIGEYLDLVAEMRKRSFPIRLRWGLEVCWLPGAAKVLESLDARNSFDFVTGSIHWLDGWGFDHKKERWNGRDVNEVYRRYFELELDLLQSGLFDHVAHPDSIKCFGHYPEYDLEPTYARVAEAAMAAKVAFEQSCGLRNNYAHETLGLDRNFLAALRARGVPLLTASDAHRPEDVGKNLKEAAALLAADAETPPCRAATRSST